MTHGLVGGNIRAAWIGKQGTQGNRSGEDWEKKIEKEQMVLYIVLGQTVKGNDVGDRFEVIVSGKVWGLCGVKGG